MPTIRASVKALKRGSIVQDDTVKAYKYIAMSISLLVKQEISCPVPPTMHAQLLETQ